MYYAMLTGVNSFCQYNASLNRVAKLCTWDPTKTQFRSTDRHIHSISQKFSIDNYQVTLHDEMFLKQILRKISLAT